ncbi:hypothetical protein ArV1_006 [Arthrobacter phage vB_ArtM-ArV1]|uniref:Uncharacterized protein n=1 Tax=Arthrobacter phage vB_ArtM-ArV1 TaxID=1566993 RepID=A0A0A7HEP5_9CAUD|nr:hypothetical protein ArV1_006 [Arthrobacter phage vB_ArtM-ArV1]AIZ01694.1 hypothetical protein ArV1_006 [Arthrobacter phage vB_ArtM-ArV1]
MAVKRDANGRFTSSGGTKVGSRSAKLAKVKGHKKAVQDNTNARHNLAQVRKKAEKDDTRAFRRGDKAAMAKTEKHLESFRPKESKLIKEQVKLGQRGKTGQRKLLPFKPEIANKKAQVKKRRAKAGK